MRCRYDTVNFPDNRHSIARPWEWHDDVIKWKLFLRYWPFVRGIHQYPCEFPTQMPVTGSFDIFFDLGLNKWLSKQSGGWWFETPSRPLQRHSNGDMESFVSLISYSYSASINEWWVKYHVILDCVITALDSIMSITKLASTFNVRRYHVYHKVGTNFHWYHVYHKVGINFQLSLVSCLSQSWHQLLTLDGIMSITKLAPTFNVGRYHVYHKVGINFQCWTASCLSQSCINL